MASALSPETDALMQRSLPRACHGIFIARQPSNRSHASIRDHGTPLAIARLQVRRSYRSRTVIQIAPASRCGYLGIRLALDWQDEVQAAPTDFSDLCICSRADDGRDWTVRASGSRAERRRNRSGAARADGRSD